jgi:hypothetical protein
MTLDDLIAKAASEQGIRPSDVLAAVSASDKPWKELFDEFARIVAERYCRGECSWEFGDLAMNSLWGHAVNHGGAEFPEFAFSVYIAFDEGEYVQRDGPPEMDAEPRTRALLARLLGNCGS